MYENQDNFQKFLTVADRLTHDIVNGVYVSGKPFLSRNEICDIYKISLKTAYKVQQLLCKRGLISGNKGKAFTVCDPQLRGGIPLSEIRLLRQNQPFITDYVMEELSRGIAQVCLDKKIEFNQIYLELQDKHYHKLSLIGGNEPGQGIVLLPYRSIMCRGAGYFLKYWQPYRVTVDFPLPGTSGVLQDELSAVNTIFDDAKANGVSSIMQLPHNDNVWNPLFSEQCFRFGQLKSQTLNLIHTQELSPELNLAIKNINNQKPDALVFHFGQKTVLDIVLEQLSYTPLIYVICRGKGEVEYCKNISNTKCYYYNYKDFGIAAAKLLFIPENGYAKREFVYIKGKLL